MRKELNKILISENYPSEPEYLINATKDIQSLCAGFIGTRETFNHFFKIIQFLGVDKYYLYREQFWKYYFDAGYISRAWLAMSKKLSCDTMSQLKIKPHQFGSISYKHAEDEKYSIVILFTIGKLIIGEWGHLGGCKIWCKSNITAPDLYQQTYDYSELSKGFDYYQQDYIVSKELWQKDISSWMKAKSNIPIPAKLIKHTDKNGIFSQL